MCPTLCAGLSFLCPTWFCAQALSFLCPTWFCTSFALSFLWLAHNEWFCSRFLHLLQRQNNFWCPACSANTRANAQSCCCSWLAQKSHAFDYYAHDSACFAGKTIFVVLHVLQYPSKNAHNSCLFCGLHRNHRNRKIRFCSWFLDVLQAKQLFCFWNLANLGHFFHGKSLYFQVEIWQNSAQK